MSDHPLEIQKAADEAAVLKVMEAALALNKAMNEALQRNIDCKVDVLEQRWITGSVDVVSVKMTRAFN